MIAQKASPLRNDVVMFVISTLLYPWVTCLAHSCRPFRPVLRAISCLHQCSPIRRYLSAHIQRKMTSEASFEQVKGQVTSTSDYPLPYRSTVSCFEGAFWEGSLIPVPLTVLYRKDNQRCQSKFKICWKIDLNFAFCRYYCDYCDTHLTHDSVSSSTFSPAVDWVVSALSPILSTF